MSVAASLVEAAVVEAEKAGAERIKSVTVEVGDFSGVVAEALAFCFEAAADGGMAGGAELVINKVKPLAHCPACGIDFKPASRFFTCPSCSGFASLKAGEELMIREMEVE
ncbi:MAG: hydrogenase maturation nickel metallochaperone HypA [Candidatus Nitrospinota bacterium M3_3B_026]